jgi:hypothetical protein
MFVGKLLALATFRAVHSRKLILNFLITLHLFGPEEHPLGFLLLRSNGDLSIS